MSMIIHVPKLNARGCGWVVGNTKSKFRFAFQMCERQITWKTVQNKSEFNLIL